MACMAILLDAEAADVLEDDRPPKVDIDETRKLAEDRVEDLKSKYKDLGYNPKHYTIGDGEVDDAVCSYTVKS